jgi:integrase
MPINLIRPSDIRAFVAELYAKRTSSGEKKLGPRRINMVRDRLYGIFAAALEDEIVSENPVARVDRLREPVPDVDPLTFDEVQSLLAEANGWEHSLLTVFCFTGLRPNEALALRWDDLDFDRNQILIRSSLSRYGLGEPKTPGSVRTIDMLPPVGDALLAQRRRARLRGEFVFPNEEGGPLDETNFRDRNWRRLLRRAGLRYRPLYHCRHTYAVLELSHGENPLYVAKQLGHTTPETTLRRYARFMRRVPRTGTLPVALRQN